MRLTVTLGDELLNDLTELTGEPDHARAVELVVERFVRKAKLQQLRELRGKVAILSIGEIEAGEQELEQAYAETANEVDFGWDATLVDGLEER